MDLKPEKSELKYAAALRFRPGIDVAPIVVASGQGDIAARILQLAAESGVPVHPEPILAKVLSHINPGMPIPPDTYRLVASILAFIWSLDQSYPDMGNLLGEDSG